MPWSRSRFDRIETGLQIPGVMLLKPVVCRFSRGVLRIASDVAGVEVDPDSHWSLLETMACLAMAQKSLRW
jgi:hypothetical protein